MYIQYFIEKGFGSREIVFFLGIHSYFGPRRTNRPYAKPNYGTEQSKFEIGYCRQTYFFTEKLAHIRVNL